MIRSYIPCANIDKSEIENLPKSEWPWFTATAKKDGTTLTLKWMAGYFDKTGNPKYDDEIEKLSQDVLTFPPFSTGSRSPYQAKRVVRSFFDSPEKQDGIVTKFPSWRERLLGLVTKKFTYIPWEEDCYIKYEFYNMEDPDVVKDRAEWEHEKESGNNILY